MSRLNVLLNDPGVRDLCDAAGTDKYTPLNLQNALPCDSPCDYCPLRKGIFEIKESIDVKTGPVY